MSPDMPIEIEVERVMNLVRGFGWEKKEQRTENDGVVLVIKKKITVPETGVPD